jgi:hypothetical protein
MNLEVPSGKLVTKTGGHPAEMCTLKTKKKIFDTTSDAAKLTNQFAQIEAPLHML